MSDTVQVRHDATVEVVFKSGSRTLHTSVIPVAELNAHVIVRSFMYNAAIDGGVKWVDPATGQAIRKPTYSWTLNDPERDILKDGELCVCTKCEGGAK